MQFEREGETAVLRLTLREAHWLKRALERASFIDIPAHEQADVVVFCERALEALGRV